MGATIYDTIGTDYNAYRTADPYLLSRISALLKPKTNRQYLDLGCGTGNYTIPLSETGIKMTGIDPSKKMIEEAQSRYQGVQWKMGSAENIPAQDESFHAVLSTLTIHHWKNIKKAFQEISRVLKSDGRFVCFTSTPEQMKGYWLNHYFPKMLAKSTMQMPSFYVLKQAAALAGFRISTIEEYYVKEDLSDHFLHVGKHRPELYFNQKIRNGISSFTALANKEEIDTGLKKLRADIDSGRFAIIKNSYENDWGDYLFMVAEKNN